MQRFVWQAACGIGLVSCSLLLAEPPQGKGPPGAGLGQGQNGAGQGEQGGPGQGPQGRMPPHPLLMIFDTDHDGAISATEFESVSKELRGLDKNGDGQLTPDELPAPHGPPGGGEGKGPPGAGEGKGPPGEQGQGKGPKNGQGPPGQGPGGPEGGMRPNPIMMVFDTDRDGAITATEFDAVLAAMRGLDKNGDGKLTLDELPRPGQGRNGGGTGQGKGQGQFQQQGAGQAQAQGPGRGPQQGQGAPGGPGKGRPNGGGEQNKNN